MDAPPLALPAPRIETRIRWWLRRAPRRCAEALPRFAVTTALLSGLFWGGYFAGGGQLEANALPLTFLHPDGPPAWVRDFSTAFCRGDVPYVTAHLAGRYAGLDETMVNEQLDSMRMNAGDCVALRYLGALSGSEGARQYIYVFDFTNIDARRSVWYVFTTMAGRVVNIE